MLDLNALIPASATIHLYEADVINDRGEIAGVGVLATVTSMRFYFFRATPKVKAPTRARVTTGRINHESIE
jgi:hypothetical protein